MRLNKVWRIALGISAAASISCYLFFGKSEMTGDRPSIIGVDLVSDSLHLALVPIEFEIGGTVWRKDEVRKRFPVAQPLRTGFSSMSFLAPGVEGLADPKTYFSTPPPNRRDRNIVSVYNIVPWTEADRKNNPAAGRDMRIGWKSRKDAASAGSTEESVYGMKCIRKAGNYPGDYELNCLAQMDGGEWAAIRIDEQAAARMLWPKIDVTYFTESYGGMTVRWRADSAFAPNFKEIDAKLRIELVNRNLIE